MATETNGTLEDTGVEAKEVVTLETVMKTVKELTSEVEDCNKVIAQAETDRETAEARKAEAQEKLRSSMKKLHEMCGLPTVSAKPVQVKQPKQPAKPQQAAVAGNRPTRKGRGGHDKSIRQMIFEYLQENSSARTSEIRQFLEKAGRPTNPGVELSRMVKDGSIVNQERGVYAIGAKK
jgi:hypothetical protein